MRNTCNVYREYLWINTKKISYRNGKTEGKINEQMSIIFWGIMFVDGFSNLEIDEGI